MTVTIINVKEQVYQEEATEVVLPGSDGELSVLDFHQDFIYALKNGDVIIFPRRKDKPARKLRVDRALAHMQSNTLTIFV
jgi:F0F1-type ATP synthase epsilon subunit